MKVIYKNAKGRELNFNESNIHFGGGDIFDYEWKPVTNERQYGVSIKQFNKEAKTLTFNIYIGGNDAERKAALNSIYEACEFDVMTQTNGKLYFMPDSTSENIENNYYISCYLVETAVESGVAIGGYTPVKLKFYCYDGFWYKESAPLYFGYSAEIGDGEFLDYPHGFPYDFSRQVSASGINNDNFINTDFKLIIHGAAVNPTVYIGGHAYGLDYTLTSDSQYITIDTTDKTITLNDNGETTSIFDYRNRDSYIFDLIAPGLNPVSWDSAFAWEIRLIEKRSAPKWI